MKLTTMPQPLNELVKNVRILSQSPMPGYRKLILNEVRISLKRDLAVTKQFMST